MNTREDKTMKRTKWITLVTAATAAALVVLGAAAGCDKNKAEKEKAENEFFKGEGVDRVSPALNAQATNGARHDAMLYPHHFDGGHLNSLGRAKVLLMLEDCENCSPINVHMVNCGEGEVLAQRKAAVELYLKTVEGPNQLTFHPSDPDIIRLAKTENPPAGGTAGAPSTDTTGASGGMGGAAPSAGAK
jgi:hypothetical protein